MDAVEGFNSSEPEGDQLEKKDDKKKKKLSPAALKKQQLKAAEEAKQAIIKQKQAYLAETKKRVQSEWEANENKIEKFDAEIEERLNLLKPSSERLEEIERTCKEYREKIRERKNWQQYMTCDRLPSPGVVSQMNSYIFVWTELDKNNLMTHCIKKTEEVMELLNSLEEVINDPGPDRPVTFVKDMKELRTEIRNLLQGHIDKATFYLFSRIDTDMIPINVTTSKYFAKCQHFQMSFWAELITPIPSSRKKEVRHPLKVVLEETEVTMVVPVSLLGIRKVIRAIWLNYDHWSDRCRTFDCPPTPSYYNYNLYELFALEQDMKKEIMHHRAQLEELMKAKIAEIPSEPTLSQEILAWESEPQRTLSDEIVYRECMEEESMGNHVKAFLNEHEVNLRERTFLGPLLQVEVFFQPPQPKVLRYKHSVTLRREPPLLHPVDFYVKYPPEEIPHVSVSEVDEVRRFHDQHKQLVDEKNKLVSFTIKMCHTVLWFEQPQVANWDPIHGYWSTEDIHDTVYDEEEGTIDFKTGRLGVMGLHVSRYCSFPYVDWTLEAGDENDVMFHLKTSKAELTFRIKENKVSLDFMKEVPSRTMNWLLGKFYPPIQLLELMKKGGIDILPAPDAAFYIEGIESKHVVIEKNVYQVWGVFCKSFRFKRSRFNQDAGKGNCLFQAQEVHKTHQVDYCTILTTMCSSFVLDVDEDSESYSPEPAPGMKSYVDLYSLLYKNSTGQARRMADATCYLLVETIKEFLSYVRPISFS